MPNKNDFFQAAQSLFIFSTGILFIAGFYASNGIEASWVSYVLRYWDLPTLFFCMLLFSLYCNVHLIERKSVQLLLNGILGAVFFLICFIQILYTPLI